MTTIQTPDILPRILDYSARADPYPLYAELRRTPVALQEDGSYVISTYRELADILHNPHLSSDVRNLAHPMAAAEARTTPSFINVDPPEHDRLRRLAMRHFGPPHTPRLVSGMEPDLRAIVSGLIDDFEGKQRIDIVDDFAYPFPVTVICHLLGVPREDEPRFHVWVNAIIDSIDYNPRTDPQEKLDNGVQATKDLRQYLGGLLEQRHGRPGDDLLTRLANDDGPEGRMTDAEIVSTANLLLIAGHETTVNLITNGMLTLLRHPEVLQRLRAEPDLVVPLVEELLRYEPPCTSFRGGRRTATSPSATPSSPRARRSCSCSPRAAAIRTASTIPTASTPIARTTSTSASAAASICASAAPWLGWKPRSP